MSVIFHDHNLLPGPQAARETAEGNFLWNRGSSALYSFGDIIDGAARDSGNTGKTNELRSGLIMGKVTSTGRLKQWAPAATDGTEVVYGVLAIPTKVIDLDGNDINKQGSTVIAGPVKSSKLFTSVSPFTLTSLARSQMRGRFIFDDDLYGVNHWPWKEELAKTANYTVVSADNGRLFTTFGAAGAVTFTLPALATGLAFGFLNRVDQNMIVASAAGDDIVWQNDDQVDSLAFQTVGEKLGGYLKFFSNVAGDRWYVEKVSQGTVTAVT